MSRNVLSDSRRSNPAAVSLFVLSWIFLFFFYPYHLVYKEQMVLFLCDSTYISDLLAKPAFLAVLSGDFLTQFFIYKGAAVTITVLLAILLWEPLRRFFASQGLSSPSLCALVPCAAELALSCHVEYPLSMTIAAAIAAWAAFGCSNIRNIKVRRTLELVAPALLFPLIGAHTLLFVVLGAFNERKSLFSFIPQVIVGVFLVLLESFFYVMTWNEAMVYPLIQGYSMRVSFLFLLTELSAVSACLVGMVRKNVAIALPFPFLLAGITIFLLFDARSEYDLKISTLAYFGKWDDVRNMGENNTYHSQTGAYYCNLSYAKEGKLPDMLLEGYQPLFYGLFLPVQMTEPYTKVIASTDALIECCDYAQAQHSAMLGMNFTPHQRSSRAVRKMAEIAVFNGDTRAATRYLGMLKKTMLHSRWAKDVESLVADGTAVSINQTIDTVFIVNDFQGSLRNILDSNPMASVAADYLLCYDLLTKNLAAFLNDYDRYYLPHRIGIAPPRIYQEALEMLEAGPGYGISAQVRKDNQSFLGGNEYLFKHSYWFYFKYAEPGE